MPVKVCSKTMLGGVYHHRAALHKLDIVVPPYVPFGRLDNYAVIIDSAQSEDLELVATGILSDIYDLPHISRLVGQVFAQKASYLPYIKQIEECVKAYCLGLFNVAICGLVPCIEGVLRNLCLSVGKGGVGSINREDLLGAVDELINRQRKELVDGYDWYPDAEMNREFLDGFNEIVQVLKSVEWFVKERLYEHSSRAGGSLPINRHGLLHGFISGSGSQLNFLKLFNFMAAVSFVAVFIDGGGLYLREVDERALGFLEELIRFYEFQRELNGLES